MGVTRFQVAIVEDAAAYRRGLGAALSEAGLVVATPTDIAEWLAADAEHALVVSLRSPESLDDLIRMAAGTANVIVALVPAPSLEMVAQAIQAGAAGVADWNDPVEVIVEVVLAALSGRTVLPVALARQLAGSVPRYGEVPALTPEELGWLSALSRGTTVAKLADDVGYSERAMFRRLGDLYARLGVHNRTEALLAADRLGLLEPVARPASH